MSDRPRATVREIDGQIVLDDPVVVEVVRAIARHNCAATLLADGTPERVAYLAQRAAARELSSNDVVIVIINVDDIHGRPLAEALMPNFDWQPIRDAGAMPVAWGLANRAGMAEFLEAVGPGAAAELASVTDDLAVIVVDHGVAEVWTVAEVADLAVARGLT